MSIEIKNGKIYIDDKGFSEETLKEMVKDHCDFEEKRSFPIITICSFAKENDRAIVRLSDEAVKRIDDGAKVVVLDIGDHPGLATCDVDRFRSFSDIYSKPTYTFGKITE